MVTALAWHAVDDRALARDEVQYRVRGLGPDAKPVDLLIVNLSAMGLMARTNARYQVGERVRLMLPVVGTVVAEIRWSLGGRMGFELDRTIDLAEYYALLAVMTKPR